MWAITGKLTLGESTTMDAIELIQTRLLESAAVKSRLANVGSSAIADAAQRIADSISSGGKLMLCGNGGSAGDSQHLAAEFTSRLRANMERPGIPALALTTDTSFITARANDYSFDEIFERLVDIWGRAGDVLIAITTSGNSRNLIRAVQRCRQKGVFTIGLLGETGGELLPLVNLPILVPSDSTQHVQESHITIGHILCELVEDTLYGTPDSGYESIKKQLSTV
jgi:phosphoheptose isomerase